MTIPPAQTEKDPQQTLHVNIIGPLMIRRGTRLLDARQLGGPKPRQILEILLLHVGVPVSKHRLIDLLWGGNPPREALTSLESYVSVLRRNLQPGAGRSGPLRTTTGGYVIDADAVELDLTEFETLVRDAQQVGPHEAHALLVEALSLAVGPLLGDELRPAWAEEERHRHGVAVTHARVLAAEAALAIGRADKAVRQADDALADDPLNERAWTVRILGLEKSGRHAEGLRAYAECRTVLDRELGCEPSQALRDAHARLLLATANEGDDLSEAVSALLLLNQQLTASRPNGQTRFTQGVADSAAVQAATQVITSFVRRVLTAA